MKSRRAYRSAINSAAQSLERHRREEVDVFKGPSLRLNLGARPPSAWFSPSDMAKYLNAYDTTQPTEPQWDVMLMAVLSDHMLDDKNVPLRLMIAAELPASSVQQALGRTHSSRPEYACTLKRKEASISQKK
jgi:hypothetical protein